MIHNPRSITTLHKRQEIVFGEYGLVLHDSRQVGIPSCFLTLTSCQMDVDEAQRGIVDHHSGNESSLVSIDTANTAEYQLSAPGWNVPFDRCNVKTSKILPLARLDEYASHQADQVV